METLDDKAINNFRKYLRIPTVHPDVNYDECVEFLKRQAADLNLPVNVITIVPKKPIVLITWTGLEPDLPAILLSSHTDVVPVFQDSWIYPPFEAHMDDKGDIYARGAQDMKCVGIMYLEAVRRLIIDGIRLRRTLHISFVPDEEIGGTDGMKAWTKSSEFKELNIGFALDEGAIYPGSDYPVFYTERTKWQIHVHCRGKPGHAAIFVRDNAGDKLRVIINKFLNFRDKMLELNGNNMLPPDEVTTLNLTKIYGGVQENVVPEQFTAVFDMRISILQDLSKFEKMLNKWCEEAGGSDVTIEYKSKDDRGFITPVDDSNPFWVALKSAASKLNVKLRPITCPGTTDSRHLREVGVHAFGITPINGANFLNHAHNEFVNKDKFLKGINMYYTIITEVGNM